MICYKCGADVGNAKSCANCGTDLHIFQKAFQLSNAYYNDGLQKAQVRNLSGAIVSLRASLKFNKYHIDARNLLGLVFYEIGEMVDAISEWVISRSYQPRDNRASDYLEAIQHNQSHLRTVNQTIKKYNQALQYCKQDSRDLAIIQLKKVLTLNPKFVKGHQLLALLYLQEGRLEQAKKTLRAAGKIDTDNTLTRKYLKEVNQQLRDSGKRKKNVQDDLISYQSGNETIIMPKRFRETSIGATIASILIGLAVGVAVTSFLVVPNVKKEAQNEANKQLLEANDTISTNEQTIGDLQAQIQELEGEVDQAQNDSAKVQEQMDAYEQLLNAYMLFTTEEVITAGEQLAEVDTSYLSSSAKAIYDNLYEQLSVQYLAKLYEDGYEAYSKNDFETAIENLLAVVEQDADYEDGNAVYYLAQSYRKNDNIEEAKEYYQYVIEHYPGTERAKTASNYVE